jgi:hypothetical protein
MASGGGRGTRGKGTVTSGSRSAGMRLWAEGQPKLSAQCLHLIPGEEEHKARWGMSESGGPGSCTQQG